MPVTCRPDTTETPRCRQCKLPITLAGLAAALAVGSVGAATPDAAERQAEDPRAAASETVLDTVTVTSTTASGLEIALQKAPASVSVVTAEDLEGKSFRDIQAALRSVPGVYLNSSPTGKGGTGEIRLRGLDPKYTLLLVNGVPQGSRQAYYNGYGQGAEYGWLPPMPAIQRIEVIRGPMSTIYGSAALGGVINVITKPVADQWYGSFSADATLQQDADSGNRYQGNFRVAGPLIDDTLSVNVNGSALHRLEDNFSRGYAGYTRRHAGVGLNWAPDDDNRISLSLGHGRQETEASADQSSSRGRDMHMQTERSRQSLRHELQWGQQWTTRSYVNREQVEQFDSSFHSTYERITANTRTVMPLAQHFLTVGAQYRLQRTRNPDRGFARTRLKRWDAALFIEDEWFMTSRFALTGGLRYVHDQNYGGELVPRIYAVYNLGSAWTLKGGISAGYRTPNLKQGDSHWIEGGCGPTAYECRDVGNSQLQPESSVSWEAGLYYRGGNGLLGSLTVFHTDFTDKIGKQALCYSDVGELGCTYLGVKYDRVNQYVNIGEATVDGVEFAMSLPLAAGLELDSSYTFTDSEQQTGDNAGLPLSNQPRHLATLGLDWQATEALRLWSQTRFQSRTLQVATRRGLSETYPAYAMVDAGIGYRLSDAWHAYGGIYNLLDKQIDPGDFGRVLDGRRFNLGVRLNF